MKNILKILVVISTIVLLPFCLKAQEEDHSQHMGGSRPSTAGGVYVDSQGNVSYSYDINDPRARDALETAEGKRKGREEEAKAREDAKAQGYDGFFYQKNTTHENLSYTGGTLNLSSDVVKAQKQNMLSDGMQSMGAISQSASTMTKSPKTAGVIMATGAGIGGLTSFVNAAGYGSLAGKYADVQAQNQMREGENNAKMAVLKAKLGTLKKGSDEYQNVQADIQEIRVERNKQAQAGKQAGRDKWGNYMGMGASMLGGSAMIFMGERQYDMYRQLDNDQKACKRDPTRCEGYVPPRPQADGRPLPVPPDTRPTGPEGFDPNRLPKPAQATASSKDSANASRGNPGARSGRAPDLLSSSGLSGRGASPMGEKSESDFGGGYSADQTFGSSSGGSGSGRESAGSYASSGGSSASGDDMNLDISQFIPSWMKDQQVPTDENGFLVASLQVSQTKNETKGLLLGKNSPSLFTRVSHAYQKKSHELKEEML